MEQTAEALAKALQEQNPHLPWARWTGPSAFSLPPPPQTVPELAARLEHTLLRPEASAAEIAALCREAVRSGCRAVCVHPWRLPLCRECLGTTPVRRVAVVAFPLGQETAALKAQAAAAAVVAGAQEIDVVQNRGLLRDGDIASLVAEVEAVRAAIAPHPLKVILETAALTEEQKIAAALAAILGGADYLKTSTGFGPGGATAEDVRLLRRLAPAAVRIKASGGIRDLATARAMIAAGADTLGTSSTLSILEEMRREKR